MADSTNNILLGHVKCSQGGRAEVRQTSKRGRHFYTRCDCCGLNQGTGAARQQHIYDNAEFIAGVTIVKPSNVDETSDAVGDSKRIEAVQESEREPAPKREAVGDFDPTASESEPEKSEPRGLVRFLPGVILLAAAGVGAWMA